MSSPVLQLSRVRFCRLVCFLLSKPNARYLTLDSVALKMRPSLSKPFYTTEVRHWSPLRPRSTSAILLLSHSEYGGVLNIICCWPCLQHLAGYKNQVALATPRTRSGAQHELPMPLWLGNLSRTYPFPHGRCFSFRGRGSANGRRCGQYGVKY